MTTEHLIKTALEFFDHAKPIDSSRVPFSEEVRQMCQQNMCGKVGKSWTCPPALEPVEILSSRVCAYPHFMILDKVYPLEDSFDWEGMVNATKDFQARIRNLGKAIKAREPDVDFMVLGAGACTLCETCSYIENKPCRSPEDAVYSVEAFGIDATALLTGNGLAYNNGPNTVTNIGGICYTVK